MNVSAKKSWTNQRFVEGNAKMQCIYCITKRKPNPMHFTRKRRARKARFPARKLRQYALSRQPLHEPRAKYRFFKSTPVNSRSSETRPMIVAFPNRPHKERKPQNAASRTIYNFKERVNPLRTFAISQNQFSFRLRYWKAGDARQTLQSHDDRHSP